MKLCVTVLVAFLASVANAAAVTPGVSVSAVAADSDLGLKLLSKARRVEEESQDENDENNNNNNNYSTDVTWVAGYSLKFQGCHHIKQWNADEDGNEDVRIATKRLVRFRLCPSSSCSENKAAGCKSGYGDYIIAMSTFLEAYYEAKQNAQEAECENYLANNCDCNDNGGGDNEERKLEEEDGDNDCEYNCYYNAEMYECIDADDDDGGFNPENYMSCNGVGDEQEDGDQEERRKLEEEEEGENDENDENEDGGQQYEYYVGPYCASQGGAIHLGMFSDDSCTEFADVTYSSVFGSDLPYENESIIGAECVSCAEMADGNDDDGNNDADYTSEQCEKIYIYAGKCENNLPRGTVEEASTNGCGYMEGIKITREDGIVRGSRGRSPAATAFIVIFALLFACMAFYVYYLRMRLGVKKDSLL